MLRMLTEKLDKAASILNSLKLNSLIFSSKKIFDNEAYYNQHHSDLFLYLTLSSLYYKCRKKLVLSPPKKCKQNAPTFTSRSFRLLKRPSESRTTSYSVKKCPLKMRFVYFAFVYVRFLTMTSSVASELEFPVLFIKVPDNSVYI